VELSLPGLELLPPGGELRCSGLELGAAGLKSGAALLEPGTAVVDLLLGGEGIDGGDVLDGVPVADGIRDRGLLGVGEGRVTAEDGGAADAAGLGDLGLERLEDRLE